MPTHGATRSIVAPRCGATIFRMCGHQTKSIIKSEINKIITGRNMIFDYNQMPADVWCNIASHGSENAIVRVSKNLNEFTSLDLAKAKIVYEQFLKLQDCFIFKVPYFDPLPEYSNLMGGLFTKDGLILDDSGILSKKDCSIEIDLGKGTTTLHPEDNKNAGFFNYYVIPVTANLIHTTVFSIVKISVKCEEELSPEKQLILQRAEKFANFYFSQPKEEKQVLSISSFW